MLQEQALSNLFVFLGQLSVDPTCTHFSEIQTTVDSVLIKTERQLRSLSRILCFCAFVHKQETFLRYYCLQQMLLPTGIEQQPDCPLSYNYQALLPF